MEVLFLNVSHKPSYYHPIGKMNYPPLGIAYLSAALKKYNINSELLDVFLTKSNDYKRVLREKIVSNEDEIVAIAISGYSDSYVFQKQISKFIKEINNNVTIISGGGLASAIPEYLLENTHIDIAIVGEGEVSLPNTIKALKNRESLSLVKGIVYKENSEIIHTMPQKQIHNIDEIPYPDYSLIGMEKYISKEYPTMTLLTARGCTGACNFCYKSFEGIRFHSVKYIIKHIEYLYEVYGIRYLKILDDNFLFNHERVRELCKYFREKGIYWNCTARADNVNLEILREIRAAGCISISFGLESASKRILESMNKHIVPENIKRAIEMCNEVGLSATVNVIFGYIDEDTYSMSDTLDFLSTLKLSYAPPISWYTPYPGTKDYMILERKGKIVLQEFLLELANNKLVVHNYTKLTNKQLVEYYEQFLKIENEYSLIQEDFDVLKC